MLNGGPPFYSLRGEGSQQGKVGFTPLYPAVNPTPHCCQCHTDVKPKFPRVINPDYPLNDSRQLDWRQLDERLANSYNTR